MASASVYFNESPIGHCLASIGKGAPNDDSGAPEQQRSCVGVCVRACVRDVFAIYDDNILSRLIVIMIIIKIIILYFIQIRHTDDFPSAGIPASINNLVLWRLCLELDTLSLGIEFPVS